MKQILILCFVVLGAVALLLVLSLTNNQKVDVNSATNEHKEINKDISVSTQVSDKDSSSLDDTKTASSHLPERTIAGYDPENPDTHTVTQHPYIITKGETNPRALSILEARSTKAYPERLSLYHKPKPFNKTAWEQNEDAYLHIVEPGRIDDMADKSQPSIVRVGSRSRQMPVCTVLALQFKAAPNSPVSMVATRGGIFTESKTNAVTVKSDAQGIATVHYYATRGTIHQTEVLAASPMNFGQASIIVTVDDKSRNPDRAALQVKNINQHQSQDASKVDQP